MSKLGRYSADRKKVVTLTSQTTGSQSQCGTIFILGSGSVSANHPNGKGTYMYFLPPLSGSSSATGGGANNAGPGWWARFVVQHGNSAGNMLGGPHGPGNTDNVHIATAPSDKVKICTATILTGSANVADSGAPNSSGNPDMIAAKVHISGSDGVTFDLSSCGGGDYVEFFTDGTAWYGEGQCSGSNGIKAFTDSVYPGK